MFTLAELEDVVPLVRASVPPTPQYLWPLLKARTGVEIVVKHENHTPIGAFKLRGGIVYFDRLKRERPRVQGIVTATRGNHGQSLAFAAPSGRRIGTSGNLEWRLRGTLTGFARGATAIASLTDSSQRLRNFADASEKSIHVQRCAACRSAAVRRPAGRSNRHGPWRKRSDNHDEKAAGGEIDRCVRPGRSA